MTKADNPPRNTSKDSAEELAMLKRIEAGDIFILETAIHLLHVLEAGVGVLQLAEHLRLQEARHRAALDVARRAGQEE